MSTTKQLAEQVPPEERAHFDDLDGLEQAERERGLVLTPDDVTDTPVVAPVEGYRRARATSITSAMMLATLKQWGVGYKPYVPTGGNSSSWLTHNRTAQQGWGPLCGVVVHNTAMTAAQASQLAYLWRGDGPTSSKPGPLCHFAVGKDGVVWLMGWGTATHSGAGDPDTVNAAKANRLPLASEITPNTTGTSAGVLRVNPHFFGIEMMHGPEGPTPAQLTATVRLTAALLWLLGGPKNGYGAPSVPMHRELTTQRSDPQLVAKGSFRPKVAAVLAAGPPATPAPTKPPAPAPAPAPSKPPVPPAPAMPTGPLTVTTQVPLGKTGTTLAVNAYLQRGAFAYDRVVEGGIVDRRLDALEAAVAALKAAAPTSTPPA